jgi:ubiquinone/menaquinone biosynthesis C-methylase UbiE
VGEVIYVNHFFRCETNAYIIAIFTLISMRDENSKDFYQKNWPLIVKFMRVDKSNCIHHGYYEKGIHTHIQSVHNMNDFVGRLLEINSNNKQGKKILDAGCGIGGTAIYLAKKYPHINVTGITVVPEHIEMANILAKENNVAINTEFIVKNFINTNFPSNQFDAIYLLESSCYALNKQILLREMYRILKTKGILIIIDVFRTNVQLNPLLKNVYLWFCKGWGLTNLIKLAVFEDSLKIQGFHKIKTRDLSKNVMRTILRGDVLSIPYLFSTILTKIIQRRSYKIEENSKFFGIVPILTTILGIKKGISYNAITAIK